MSTPPLLDLPVSACAGSMVMGLTRVVGVTESPYTFESQSFKWPGERWNLSFRMPPIKNKRVANEWISFGLSLQGKYGRFLAGDFMARVPQGVASGTPLVNGGNQTGNILNTKGWNPNITNILMNGDNIQLGTGISSRLYRVVKDVNSNASGNASIQIEPALKSSPADGAAITVNNPRGVFRLVDNQFAWSVEPGPVWRVSFEAVEVI